MSAQTLPRLGKALPQGFPYPELEGCTWQKQVAVAARNCIPSCHQTPLSRFWCVLSFPQAAPPALPEPKILCPIQNITFWRSVQQLGMSLCRDLSPGVSNNFSGKTLQSCTNPTVLFSSMGPPYFQKTAAQDRLCFRLSLPGGAHPIHFCIT